MMTSCKSQMFELNLLFMKLSATTFFIYLYKTEEKLNYCLSKIAPVCSILERSVFVYSVGILVGSHEATYTYRWGGELLIHLVHSSSNSRVGNLLTLLGLKTQNKLIWCIPSLVQVSWSLFTARYIYTFR